jgi:hypothetical protein
MNFRRRVHGESGCCCLWMLVLCNHVAQRLFSVPDSELAARETHLQANCDSLTHIKHLYIPNPSFEHVSNLTLFSRAQQDSTDK